MRFFVHLTLALSTLAFVAADEKKQAPENDLKAIQGSWKIVEIQTNGESIKPPQEMIFTFGEGTVDQQMGQEKRKSKYKLDPRKNPRQLDTTTERNGETMEFKMIYSIDGDILKICSKRPRTERPAKFSSQDGHSIAVFRRFERE